MPFLFTCPHCRAKTQVEDRYRGQAGTCVVCGGAIAMPAADGPAGAPGPHGAAPRTPTTKSPLFKVTALGIAVLLLGLVGTTLYRFSSGAIAVISQNQNRQASSRNLEKIADALNAYAADYNRYPPPVTYAADGTPMHSWRVLILPYLDEKATYDNYNLNAPWDDVTNQVATEICPDVYRPPALSDVWGPTESAYQLVTGPQTLFPGKQAFAPENVTDPPGQTLLVVEARAFTSTQTWAEPYDLDFATMTGQVGGNFGTEIGGWLDGGAVVATVDGRAHFLPDDTPPQTVRALITPRGGERLPDDTLR